MSKTSEDGSGTRRGLLFGLPLTVAASGAFAFFANVMSVQETVCAVGFAQPGISDACGAMRAGDRPTKSERIAWAAVEIADCDALRRHIQSFPEGVYRDDAADLLAASRTKQTETWQTVERRLAIFLDDNGTAMNSLQAAKDTARANATKKAEQMCRSFAATASYKLDSAKIDPQEWFCDDEPTGHVCGLQGDAVCSLQLRGTQQTETCEAEGANM